MRHAVEEKKAIISLLTGIVQGLSEASSGTGDVSSESLLGSGSDAGEEHDDIADFLRHYKPPNRPRLGKASNKKPQYPLDFLVARVLFLAGRVSLGAEQICTRVASEWLYFGTVPPPALLTMMLGVQIGRA